MTLIHQLKHIRVLRPKIYLFYNVWLRSATTGCTTFEQDKLTTEMKHQIEQHWRTKLPSSIFNANKPENKHYVLSMFPYPSGDLHMGHVRVYTISDAMARYFRLNGKNVLQPMGWDAFGLPAENAAIERNISSEQWTKNNIAEMKKQLDLLGCSFDWTRELSTCDPSYYKWTQWLFLQLFREGLAYQQGAIVNWDPVDKTVLAHEQVDENGRAWRSGAKVEKKLLKQWFIRTSKHLLALQQGLDEIHQEDWKEVISIQKHWIGDCNGYSFCLDLLFVNRDAVERKLRNLTVWTENPEELLNAGFVAIKSDHVLNHTNNDVKLLDVAIKNPFKEGMSLPIIVCDDVDYPPYCDTYIGVPSIREKDEAISSKLRLEYDKTPPAAENRDMILKKARQTNIGGDLVSSKHQNWLISRQRFWGTPIPIIHCQTCGTVAVPDTDLPVLLPPSNIDENGKSLTLKDMNEWKQAECPKCGDKNAQRETDTMDTFMDSSWYYLRFLDPNNSNAIFDKQLVSQLAPVDLYIGGREHATLHMYYARFIQHFLHDLGLVPEKEPFRRLIPQGMVLGQTFQVKETGKYLCPDEVTIINEKKNQATETATGKPVKMEWLKMSKSKKNGVAPVDLLNEYSTDTIRLIMLADVAPKTPREWSKATFPGIIYWQNRIWETVTKFNKIRCDDSIAPINAKTQAEFDKYDKELFDERNAAIITLTRQMDRHILNSAFKAPQGLTKFVSKLPVNVIKFSPQYELSLANIIVTTAPYAPHFASELWSKFISIPNRINETESEIIWDKDVLEQKWPLLDKNYQVPLKIRINHRVIHTVRYPLDKINEITRKVAVDCALTLDEIRKFQQEKGELKFYFMHKGEGGINLIIETKNKKKQNIDTEDEDHDTEIRIKE